MPRSTFTSKKNAEIDDVTKTHRAIATENAKKAAAEAAAAKAAAQALAAAEAERMRKKERAQINEGTKKDFIRHAKKIENIIREKIKEYDIEKNEIAKTRITLKSRYKPDTYEKNLEKEEYLALGAELNEKLETFNADVKNLDKGDYRSLSFYKSLVVDPTISDSPASSASPAPASASDAPTTGALGGGKYRKKSRKKKNTSNKKIKKKVKSRKI